MRQLIVSSPAVVLLTSAVLWVDVAAAPLSQTPTASEKSELVSDLMRSSDNVRGGISDVVRSGDLSSLSLGEYIHVYRMSDAFYSGAVTDDLQSEVVPYEELGLMVLARNGEPIGVMSTWRDSESGWLQSRVYDAACVAELAELEPGDRIIAGMWQEFYAVRGESVSGLDGCSMDPLVDVGNLAEYQESVLAAQGPEGMVGGLPGGGKGDLPRAQSGMTHGMAGALAIAAGGVTLGFVSLRYLRRRATDQRD